MNPLFKKGVAVAGAGIIGVSGMAGTASAYDYDNSLENGDSGAEVEQLQSDLNYAGYNTIVDGEFGPDTEGDVQKFQDKYDLSYDGSQYYGTFGPSTQDELNDVKDDVSLENGDSGNAVEQLQRDLDDFGYDTTIDGEFGPATEDSVQQFQSDYDLSSPEGSYYGVAGPATLEALEAGDGSSDDGGSDGGSVIDVSAEDEQILDDITEAESSTQIYDGKVAVAEVIINRVQSSQYPDNVKDVVYQDGQFSPVMDGRIDEVTPDSETKNAVDEALAGSTIAGESLFFLNEDTAESSWIVDEREHYKDIDEHSFYL